MPGMQTAQQFLSTFSSTCSEGWIQHIRGSDPARGPWVVQFASLAYLMLLWLTFIAYLLLLFDFLNFVRPNRCELSHNYSSLFLSPPVFIVFLSNRKSMITFN